MSQEQLPSKGGWSLPSLYTTLFLSWMLIVLVAMGVYRYIFNAPADKVFELALNAFFAYSLAFLTVAIPIQYSIQQRKQREDSELRSHIIAAASYLHSELSLNLSMLKYTKQELEKDYSQEPPVVENPTKRNKQDLEMGKIRGAAREVLLSLTDRFYTSLLNSGTIIKLGDEKLAEKIQMAYEGINHARGTLRRQGEFFAMVQDSTPPTPYGIQVGEHIRREKVPKAIQIVHEDIELAIGRIKAAQQALNDAVRPYGKQMKMVYRDEAIEEMHRQENKTVS